MGASWSGPYAVERWAVGWDEVAMRGRWEGWAEPNAGERGRAGCGPGWEAKRADWRARGKKGWAAGAGLLGQGESGVGPSAGPRGLGWKGSRLGCNRFWAGFLVLVFLSIPPFLILILFLTQTNLFEFKQNLNSTTLCTQANKNKCSSMMQQQNLTLDKILIT